MEWIRKSDLLIGRFSALAAMAPGLEVFVTTRPGGVSAPPFDSLNLGAGLGDSRVNIRENRRRLLDTLGISPRRLARTGQIHGAEIAVVTKGGLYRGMDGFATDRQELALAISTADCYPLVIYSPPERVLAALHVGRKGAERGIVDRAVAILRDRFLIEPAYAVAAIGPGICGGCYAVSRGEAMKFPPPARRFRRARWHLDLEEFIRRRLRVNGLVPDRILSSGLCTACRPDLFFSYRRDRRVTGRHWTVAVIRDPAAAVVRRD